MNRKPTETECLESESLRTTFEHLICLVHKTKSKSELQLCSSAKPNYVSLYKSTVLTCIRNVLTSISACANEKGVPMPQGTTARRTIATCRSNRFFCRTATNAMTVGIAFSRAKKRSSLKRLQRSAKYPQGIRTMSAAMPQMDSICPTVSLEPEMSRM